MNDRFKFRAWNIYENKMAYDCQFNLEHWLEMEGKEGGFGIISVMQCTGLKDKNGVLIYEGDIIKRVNPHWHIEGCTQCICCEGLVLWCDSRAAFYTIPIDYRYGNTQIGEESKIIGNKFEHPHLLSKEQGK